MVELKPFKGVMGIAQIHALHLLLNDPKELY